MRCEDVARELSAPGGCADRNGLSEHLATCSRCAAWAVQVARFDQLWRETRPIEPDREVFDGIWARVMAASAPIGGTRKPLRVVEPKGGSLSAGRGFFAGRQVRLWLAPVAAVAAALLLAFVPGLATRWGRPVEHPSHPAVLRLASFEAEAGETLYIEIEGNTATSTSLPPSDVSDTVTVAAELDIFNFMESQDSL